MASMYVTKEIKMKAKDNLKEWFGEFDDEELKSVDEHLK